MFCQFLVLHHAKIQKNKCTCSGPNCFRILEAPGRPHGPEASVPKHGGWVRVQWQVTGSLRNYRLGLIGSTGCRDLKFAEATRIRSNSDYLASVQKGMLKLHHLRCDFGYQCGTKHSHYAKFDIRKEACLKVAGFVHGDVVEDRQGGGRRSTCIGLKYNAEKEKVAGPFLGKILLCFPVTKACWSLMQSVNFHSFSGQSFDVNYGFIIPVRVSPRKLETLTALNRSIFLRVLNWPNIE